MCHRAVSYVRYTRLKFFKQKICNRRLQIFVQIRACGEGTGNGGTLEIIFVICLMV